MREREKEKERESESEREREREHRELLQARQVHHRAQEDQPARAGT